MSDLVAKIKNSQVYEYAVPGWEVDGEQVTIQLKPVAPSALLSSDMLMLPNLTQIQEDLKNGDVTSLGKEDIAAVSDGMREIVFLGMHNPRLCTKAQEDAGEVPEDRLSYADLGLHVNDIFSEVARISGFTTGDVAAASGFREE